MKKTYYWKDHLRIYWRLEFDLECAEEEKWALRVFRSLESHDDPEAAEVFHSSYNKPDPVAACLEMAHYYKTVTQKMKCEILTLYDATIE